MMICGMSCIESGDGGPPALQQMSHLYRPTYRPQNPQNVCGNRDIHHLVSTMLIQIPRTLSAEGLIKNRSAGIVTPGVPPDMSFRSIAEDHVKTVV